MINLLERVAAFRERFGDQPAGGNQLHLRQILVTPRGAELVERNLWSLAPFGRAHTGFELWQASRTVAAPSLASQRTTAAQTGRFAFCASIEESSRGAEIHFFWEAAFLVGCHDVTPIRPGGDLHRSA